jgi:hypothetical protein
MALDVCQVLSKALCQGDPARADTNEHEISGASVTLKNFMRNASQPPLHGGCIHCLRFNPPLHALSFSTCHVALQAGGKKKPPCGVQGGLMSRPV